MPDRPGPGRQMILFSSILLLLAIRLSSAQLSPGVSIQVKFDQSAGPIPPVWNYFGYDEPNYTYAPNGRKLLRELAALDASPAYVRVHNLLTTGDGSASLKWGSTNVYSEDASGNPVYSWVILDQIFDTFRGAGVKPLVEIGFMPKALSTRPEPYRHAFPSVPVSDIYTGWAYPPKSYPKWSELVFQFVDHLRKRYGEAEVNTWLWEVWNEPDIGYWKGTPEEYFKLYDFTVDAVLRALPGARIGGPDTTGPGNSKAADFLRAFLEHCAHQKNYAEGRTGSRLDFISFHPKGSPTWQGDHVQMGISRHNPQNSYRNGPLYGAYTLEVLHHVLELARQEHINLRGAVTWAFEFEDQPYFAGFRELATNGVDKPVLNAFRMLGLLGDERVEGSSSNGLATEEVVHGGVRAQPDINTVATRKDRELEILVWNYHDDDIPFPPAPIDLVITGLPADAKRGLLEHFRVDAGYSNAFTTWKDMGSPESPSASEYERLQLAGQLQLLDSPAWIAIPQGTVQLQFSLPRQGISLVRLAW
jgi:xylan 1,4-beta-xylosidase